MAKKVAIILLVILLLVVAVGVFIFNPFKNKIKAGLQVITDQTTTSLFLDGQYLDKTPYINKQIQPGQYNLRIEPEDSSLTAYETPITLKRGTITVVTWNLGRTLENSGGIIYELESGEDKQTSEISFVSSPDGAIISFDDRENEFTPLVIKELEPGDHEFEASLPSYQSQKHAINLIKGMRLKATIKLAKAEIELDEQANKKKEVQEKDASPSARQKKLNQTASESGDLEEILKIKPTDYFVQEQEVLRVRDNPTNTAEEIGLVKSNHYYKFLGNISNNWYQIEFTDNSNEEVKQGWVSGKYVQLEEGD
ncbi:MAG: PEGA domain-containing protein [Patescibacteria group bacterium]|nr:PEGA domain-containing protein [Patescibacteria group bacterium]